MEMTVQRKKKQKDEVVKRERNVASPTRCLHCKGDFWSPNGKQMCPWCGKYLIVTDGVQDSITGFFSKLLEGIALSRGVSGIEVSLPYLSDYRASTRP